VQKSLARCHFHPYARVVVRRIPPVVPCARLDDGRLALMKDAGLPVKQYGQFALEHRELLDERGVIVFSSDTRSYERGQLGGSATHRIVPGTL